MQQELNLPLVVYFYADWCPYCHALEARYLPAPQVQDYLRRVVKVRINPEHGRAERDLAAQYGVRGYPAFFVIRRASSSPVKVHPFTQAGNLTPAEFAHLCQQAGPVSKTALSAGDRNVVGRSPKASTETEPVRARGAQMVTVKPTAATPTFLSDGPIPSTDEVFKKYSEAVGSRQAQMRLTSRVTTGRIDVPGVSNGGRFETYAMAPNKALTVMKMDPVGVMRQGFDGSTAWEQSEQRDVRSSTGNDLARLARDAEFYSVLKLKELYPRTRCLGKVKEGFRQVYKVEAIPRVGSAETFYFDADSGLLVRHDVDRMTSQGLARAEFYFNDWREVDGVKVPFRVTEIVGGLTYVIMLEEVKHNTPLDEAIFRRPSR